MNKITEARGRITSCVRDGTEGYRLTVSLGRQVVDIRCGTRMLLSEGDGIHFFYSPDGTAEVIPEPGSPLASEGILNYIRSGRIAGLDESDAETLGEAFSENLAGALSGGRKATAEALGAEKAALLSEGLARQKWADRLYIALKRACPGLTWGVFADCMSASGWRLTEKAILSDPFAFLEPAELGFAEADGLAESLGAAHTGRARLEAFVSDLFTRDALKCSTCCPKDVLTECLTAGAGVNRMDAEAFIAEELENGKLVQASNIEDEYIYTRPAYSAEKALAGYIAAAAGRSMRDTGMKKALRYINGAGLCITDEETQMLETVAGSPLTAVAADDDAGIERAAELLKAYFEGRKVPCRSYRPGGNATLSSFRTEGPDEKCALIVGHAEKVPYMDHMNIFREAGKKEKIILIGAPKNEPGVTGCVFAEVIRSGVCPAAGARLPGGVQGMGALWSMIRVESQ